MESIMIVNVASGGDQCHQHTPFATVSRESTLFYQVGLGKKGEVKQRDLDGNGVYYEIWNKIQLQGAGQKGHWGNYGG
jgi:hypothetical protein